MPYCNMCGKEIKQGTYCETCLPNVVQKPRETAAVTEKPKKKKKAWVVFPVAAVLIMAVVVVAVLPMAQGRHAGQPVWIRGKKEDTAKTVEQIPQEPPYSGTCENGISWELDKETGKLTITGNGSIADYSEQAPAPWSAHSDKITSIELQSGITAIGDGAFAGCSAVTQVTIPAGVTAIGAKAFAGCTALPEITLPESLTLIEQEAFLDCSLLEAIHHTGSLKQWQAVQVEDGNQDLMECSIEFDKLDPAPKPQPSGGSSPAPAPQPAPEPEPEPETNENGMVSGGRYDEMPIVTIEDGKVVVRPNPGGGLIE